MTCKLCNDTGDQRYWEGRWRDERAENERLRVALKAQQEADDANEGRAPYETWQALQDKADELRRAALAS